MTKYFISQKYYMQTINNFVVLFWPGCVHNIDTRFPMTSIIVRSVSENMLIIFFLLSTLQQRVQARHLANKKLYTELDR